MTAAFGFAGMFTKGRMAYVEKGSRFVATISEDRAIAPPAFTSGDGYLAKPSIGTSVFLDDDTRHLAIEKKRKLSPIEVWVELPDGRTLSESELQRLSLVRVNDLVVPETVEALSVSEKQYDKDGDKIKERKLTFDAWKVLRYCDAGPCELRFRGQLDDGSSWESVARTEMKIVKKEK
jgi:hypothetical protein